MATSNTRLALSKFKEFCRNALVPPAIWSWLAASAQALRRRTKPDHKSKTQFPYVWDGDAFELKHALRHIELTDEVPAVGITRGRDTRPSVEIFKGRGVTLGPFPADTKSVALAVAQDRMDLPYSDLTVMLNGQVVTEIKGSLIAETWNNFRLPIADPLSAVTLELTWTGERLFLSEPVPERGMSTSDSQRPNFIVLVLDSMVPETVGSMSGASPDESFTPHIDRYFRDGRLYTNAYSQSEYTMPSLATMMTGLYPIQHGVFTHDRCQRTIPPQTPTLAEFLQEAGYRTFCYSTGRRFVPPYGHYRGFERFHFHNQSLTLTSDTVVDRAMEFIETHKSSPTFCFLHIIDPHPPFALPTYFSELNSGAMRWGDSRSLYDAFKLHRDSRERVAELREMERVMVRNLDFILGKLFAYLEREGLDEKTHVMILADHGREYMKGSPLLTRRLTHIPFLLSGPGVSSGMCDKFIEPPVDLYPSIAALSGLTPPPHLAGRDVVDPKAGYREVCLSESLFRFSGEIALRTDDRIYALRFPLDDYEGKGDLDAPEGEWLFRRDPVTKDEASEENLIDSEPERVDEFRRLARTHYDGIDRYFSNDNVIASTREYPR